MAAPGVAFAVSPLLLAHLETFNSPRLLHLLPNVRTSGSGQPAPPALIEGLPRPIVGLIGDINDRYDFDVLAAVADAIPEGTLLLAGRVSLPEADRAGSGYGALVKRANVRRTGELTPSELLGVVASLDVGLLPVPADPANRHASPVKVFDYLHARVPVVSSGVADLGSAAQWVRVADDRNGFVGAVQDALQSGRIGADIETWLEDNTAEARAREALEVLARAAARR